MLTEAVCAVVALLAGLFLGWICGKIDKEKRDNEHREKEITRTAEAAAAEIKEQLASLDPGSDTDSRIRAWLSSGKVKRD